MTKTTKILLAILGIILLIVIGYFAYQKYQDTKRITVVPIEDDWTNYNNELLARSVFGKIVNVTSDSITVINQDDNKEATYKINEDTLIEKLGPADADGSQSFQETDISELAKDKNVWVILDSEDNTLVATVKLTDSDASSLVIPTPTQ